MTPKGRSRRLRRTSGARRLVLLTSLVLLASGCVTVPPVGPTDSTWPPTEPPTLRPGPARVKAQAKRVIDGDTIEVEVGGETYTVRYIGIDAPESVHPTEPVEWMGPEASWANQELVEGETVYLEKDVSETDRYGRLLRHVFLEDGTLVSAELVRLGYALVSTYPPDVKYQYLLLQMQAEARTAERGLWGATPTPEDED